MAHLAGGNRQQTPHPSKDNTPPAATKRVPKVIHMRNPLVTGGVMEDQNACHGQIRSEEHWVVGVD